MRILTAVKIVPDDQDIQVSGDGTLDFSKARPRISEYDLNAIEASARLAEATGSTVSVVTAGPASIDNSKLKKDVLARGVDDLYMAANDALDGLDAYATAGALADLVGQAGAYDIIICGDGSADLYAKQTGAQLAAKLGVPYVAGVVSIEAGGAGIIAKRRLEDVVETVEVALPAVVSVLPDIALPRICGMKDILAAGKKPMNMLDVASAPEAALEVVSCKAPEQAERKLEVVEASAEGALESFAAALKAAL